MKVDFADELEIIMHSNEEQTEITIVMKGKSRLSNEQVIIELESLAHDLSKADDQLKQPGVRKH